MDAGASDNPAPEHMKTELFRGRCDR